MAESVKSPMVTSAKQPTECIHMGQSMRERERERERERRGAEDLSFHQTFHQLFPYGQY